MTALALGLLIFLFSVLNWFPDSTLRGDAEQGDNNQVQVALALYLLDRENNRREAVVGLGECV